MMAAKRFPHYATHRPYHGLVEYAGWIRRLALKRKSEREAAAAIEDLAKVPDPLFFFPLQLDCDYQMRMHSPFRAAHLAIEHVLASFARDAPDGAKLVVKLHPLDSGLIDWRAVTGHLAAEFGIAERLIVIDGGDIDKLLARCQAVVTVNSTVGCLALARGVPVIALGKATYDIAGLTYQGELGEFWSAPRPPDPDLFDAFRRVLAARCLIPGSFFSEAGLRSAVAAAYSLEHGLTLIRVGGHFSGFQVLHSAQAESGQGALFTGDQPQVCPDRRYVSFMYSYPNFIPLDAASVRRIVAALEPFPFIRLYGAWRNFVVQADAKEAVRRSAERYIRALETPRADRGEKLAVSDTLIERWMSSRSLTKSSRWSASSPHLTPDR
jgi:hypothetical protein